MPCSPTSARHPTLPTMPPDVAARLDETLAGLVAERAEPEERDPGGRRTPAPAVDHPRRRGRCRRHRDRRRRGRRRQPRPVRRAVGLHDLRRRSRQQQGGVPGRLGSAVRPPLRLRPTGSWAGTCPSSVRPPSTREATRLARTSAPPSTTSAAQRKAAEDSAGGDTAVGGLSRADGGRQAQHLVVLYDGTPAALVVHPAKDGERLVEAWTCGGDRRLDSATVPVGVPTSGKSRPRIRQPQPVPVRLGA